MAHYHAFRLSIWPTGGGGGDVAVTSIPGARPPSGANPRVIDDLVFDRALAEHLPGSGGWGTYRFEVQSVLADTAEWGTFELKWPFEQEYSPEQFFPAALGIRYTGPPVFEESTHTVLEGSAFDLYVVVDGAPQGAVTFVFGYVDDGLVINLECPGFVDGTTYRVTMYGDGKDVYDPPPMPPAFWTNFIGARERI